MKKIVRMILLCSLLVLSVVMVGCGSSSSTNNGGNSNDSNDYVIKTPSLPNWIYGKWANEESEVEVDFYKNDALLEFIWLEHKNNNDNNNDNKYDILQDSNDKIINRSKKFEELINNDETKTFAISYRPDEKESKIFMYFFQIGKNDSNELLYISPSGTQYILTKESNSDSN